MAAARVGPSVFATDLTEYTCAICKDVFQDPVRTECDHVYCNDCLKASLKNQTHCPECREPVNEDAVQKAVNVSKKMEGRSYKCDECDQAMTVKEARGHQCVASTREPAVRQKTVSRYHQLPNRHTFPCAYCQEKNFDRESLLKHCNNEHKDAPNHKLVCTICVAYPWGDKNQKSGDLLQHLNVRHKVDYDRFVNYEEDDETALYNVIKKSREEY